MKTAYLDAFSGLSGDMLVAAMLDAGADFAALERLVGSLPISGHRLVTRRKSVSGIAALKFDVNVLEPQPERHLREIRAILEAGGLAPPIAERALRIFEVLAEAEARVHRTTPEAVHFHEVGAVDSIIDIVGAAWGMEQLGVAELLVSQLPMGSGFARSRHGVIPVPAPATVELLAGFPVRLNDGAGELVTPTGAAVLKAFAHPAAEGLPFEIERIGYGAGSKEFADRPNVLRLMLGREIPRWESDQLLEIAANIDDLNPQVYDHLSGRLFAAGARDVTLTPTMMKKGRPGVLLSVLTEAAKRDKLTAIVFDETSTIGVRFHPVSRFKLPRRVVAVETRFGSIRVKLSGEETGPMTVAPEYEDCHAAALAHAVPLRTVQEAARAAAEKTLKP